ncbi:hypothetical protein INT44_007317 [Umbelopsis vinacea]|uniref:Band 7 domain-containing protein n=1 Tax=Umbelopsis vinacea TaxID=44442 RepID=A0A8H7PMP1_9FUNG|nr:hypothetical protein INT44_007317 [Umbelopsis vinacea]
MYKVAEANQYVVKTGFGVADILVCKKCMVWPGQTAQYFDVTPHNFELSLHAMSVEKLEFLLPAVMTIGPKIELPSLVKYARLMTGRTKSNVPELVKGIIEGETRVIAAGMSMEEIFKDRKAFKENIIRNVQSELDHFGLYCYNTNIKSLQDTPGSEYFSYMRMKTQEGAVNQAKIDVADARFKGDVGEKEKVGLTRQEVGRIEADTVIYENEKKAAISQANARLEARRAEFDRQVETAKIEAKQASSTRQIELQREYEEKRQLAETERLRADVVAKWKAEYEVGVQKANTELYNQQRKADAELFKKQQEAEGMFITAAKAAEAQMKKADAYLYEKQKEAEAISEVMAAQANGLKMLVNAFNGDTNAALNYLMVERGTFQAMAKENANAIKGLNPKITVWNQDGKAQSNPIADIYKSLPPLIDTVREQTGIMPPTWLANMTPNANEVTKSQTLVNGKA